MVDLLADDTPVFNLAKSKFEYGYSIIGTKVTIEKTEQGELYTVNKKSLNHIFDEIV